MVLSEAIRLGATLGPQIKGSFIGPDGATCTLGAALLAIGIKDNNAVDLSVFPSLVKEMPELRDIKAGLSGYLFKVIGRLSDQKGWTREQIRGLDCGERLRF